MVTVRPAVAADVEGVQHVAEAAWWSAYAGFLDDETVRDVTDAYDEERLTAAIETDDVYFVVAVDEGREGEQNADDRRVVGFASARQTWADEVELFTLYVDPDRWGEGVGGALLDDVLDFARERDVDRVVARVFEDNPFSTFFTAQGFERWRTVDDPVGEEVHPAVVFEKDL